jgi:hypothetical protein
MPRGPKGEKRPADVIGNAVHVMRIATGEIEDNPSKAPKRAKGGNDLAEIVDAAQPKPGKRGQYKKRAA